MNLFQLPKLEIPVRELYVEGSSEYKAKSRLNVYSLFVESRGETLVSKENIRSFIESAKEKYSIKYTTDLKRVIKKSIELWLERKDVISFYYQEWEYFFRKLRLKRQKPKKYYAEGGTVPGKWDLYKLIEKVQNPRYQLMFITMFYLGSRPKELRELKLSDVIGYKLIEDEVEYSLIKIDSYKTGERFNKIPTQVINDIKTVFRPKTYLFENTKGEQYSPDRLGQIVREQTRKYSDLKLTPYLFRHMSATEYYELTKDDDSGAERLGHNIITHRKHYVHNKFIDKSEVLHTEYQALRNCIKLEYVKRVG